MMPRLLKDVARLIGSWWKIDRVRISPREGRLLRLKPPCVVVVEDRPAEVLARTLGRNSATTIAGAEESISVVYDCRSVAGAYRLRLAVAPGGTLEAVYWTTDGCERRIMEESVEVYSG
jgi:adenylate kinase